MDNLDDSENQIDKRTKISDSAYSNSCSNSQSRRSHSSKSTHSGSNSSGSSGYGGKPSTSMCSNNLNQHPKKEKEVKKKNKQQSETLTTDSRTERECRPKEDLTNVTSAEGSAPDVLMAPPPKIFQTEKGEEDMDICIPETSSVKNEEIDCNLPLANVTTTSAVANPAQSNCDGFSCVISMHDGIVMYTTSSITATLGFPKDMWIGRSFIDFLHPRDRDTFASQITHGLAIPKILNLTQEKIIESQGSTMVCRIRRYRGLSSGFGVKDTSVSYMPFLLKFRFRNISDDKGIVIYLVIQTIPFFSAYKTPNEILTKDVSFVMRHCAKGNLEYIDPESVPYLGYMPQDITNRDALFLYHSGDLAYLQEVYESIVKQGSVTRSKPYRMLTQNGHSIKVETEWSAFINPWSKKLEFVTGKHYIIEGPANPDVFEYPDPEKAPKLTDEQKDQAQVYRNGIISIMNDVRTKPAEIAKQQMSKRCQDLALFMEILLEEQPKAEEEFRLQIQDVDHSYYERDSVMLGGISPHHEYNDSKSSTETPLSYNQLNYNDNLQRYFNSHQPNPFLDTNALPARNPADMPKADPLTSNCMSPMAQYSGDSTELTSSSECSGLVVFKGTSPVLNLENYVHLPLTESLLIKHNAEMEKELMKLHREHRCFSKGDREKVTNEVRQKKKEHLARCNATFQTIVVANNTASVYNKAYNLKRSSKQLDSETVTNKYHCPSSRQPRRKQTPADSVSMKPFPITTVASQWSANPVENTNSFILGVEMPPQMSIMSPLPVMSGMFPMYYTPANASSTTTTAVSPSASNARQNDNHHARFQQPLAQCMMYGQPIYGSPIMYSPISPQNPYFQQTLMAHNIQYNNALNPLCLANSNYEEACRNIIPARSSASIRHNKKRTEKFKNRVNKNEQSDGDSVSHNTMSAPGSLPSGDVKVPGRLRKSDETMDRTDESSYSSFYSSFFKTESGSAEDSNDIKKICNVDTRVTTELIYKYQIITKPLDEILSSDKQKIKVMEQPTLVNEQLGQLYLDLQLEGVAARLTLEEGITSSSSSEETPGTSKITKRKREYNKLSMIYEENAPLPSPEEDTR